MMGHVEVKLYHLKPQTLKHVEILKVLHKLTYSKGLDLEIACFEYHDDPTYTGEITPSQTSNP